MSENNAQALNSRAAGEKLLTITYLLYGLGLVLGGIPTFAAIIIDYIKKDSYQDTFLSSHFQYQIRTFWISFALSVLGFILLFAFGLGLLILIPTGIWYIYRIIKGYLNLNDQKPMV